ncbi:hypothetical protein ES705_46538 [subsurface metagenome]
MENKDEKKEGVEEEKEQVGQLKNYDSVVQVDVNYWLTSQIPTISMLKEH